MGLRLGIRSPIIFWVILYRGEIILIAFVTIIRNRGSMVSKFVVVALSPTVVVAI